VVEHVSYGAVGGLAVKALRIEFTGARLVQPWWSIALFVIGTGACISAVWHVSALNLAETRAAADVTRAQAAISARRPPPAPVVTVADSRIDAINVAISDLNLPWQALFSSLEQVKPKNVALLGLEPNASKHVLRVFAETKQAEDMLEFVRLIRQQPQFTDAVLVKHEVYMQDPNRPLRFSVEAVWKADL